MKQMKKLVFVGTSVDLDTLDSSDDVLFITMQLSDEFKLRKNGFNVKLFHRCAQTPVVWNDIIHYSTKWLTESHAPELKFDNVLLWDLLYDEFFESPGGAFETIYSLVTILSLIKELQSYEIEIVGIFYFDIYKILTAISQKYNLQIKNNSKLAINKENILTKLGHIALFMARFMIGKIASCIIRTKSDANFILTHGFYAKKIKNIISDLYLEGVHEYFLNKGKTPTIISLNIPRLHNNIYVDILLDFFHIMIGEYKPFSAYLSISDLLKKHNNSLYDQMILNTTTKPLSDFSIDGIQISVLIVDKLSSFLQHRIPDCILGIKTCRRYLECESPQKILNIEGSNLFGKSLALCCDEKKIKVFIPQLGIISKEIPLNSSFFIRKNSSLNVLPTIFVWGKHFRDIIEKRGYPKSKIIESGMHRHEQIKSANPNMCDKYLLYIASANTQPDNYISNVDEDITTIKEIAKITPKDMRVIVKLHPTHHYAQYRKNLESNIMILQNNEYDITKLIDNAAVVIGKCSTLLLQSFLREKKTLVVNLSSSMDFCGLHIGSFVDSIELLAEQINGSSMYVVKNFNEEICSNVGDFARKMLFDKFYDE